MNYLLDVNVLVAWGWSDHVDHERTVAWIAAARRRKTAKLMTSAIPELGFVRVSVQRTGGRVTVAEATETLAGMVAALGARHVLLADDQAARQFPEWCSSASRSWPPSSLTNEVPGASQVSPFLHDYQLHPPHLNAVARG